MNTPWHLAAEAAQPIPHSHRPAAVWTQPACLLLLLVALVAALLTGCASPETAAYRTLGATAYTVDGAMNGWGDYVRAGKATPAQEASVKAAYERYQSAMRVARAAVVSYKTAPDKPALDRALDATDAARVALIELLHLLQK